MVHAFILQLREAIYCSAFVETYKLQRERDFFKRAVFPKVSQRIPEPMSGYIIVDVATS